MDILAVVTPLSVLSGFVVGLLVGLTGVGGGSLMTPLLILLFGIPATTAVGTDLLYAAATKAAGSVAHGMAGTVDWPITLRLAGGSLPGAVLTVIALHLAGISGHSSPPLITTTLGISLLLSAAAVLARYRIRRWSQRFAWAVPNWRTPITVAAGFILGVLVTISSIGAGALGMVILISLYPWAPVARLVGSDIVHAVPLTLAAGVGYWWLGSVDFVLMASLLLGSVPGILLGSRLGALLPEWVLRPILALILLAVGVRLLLRD
jgi:uncharacterized membrane protein YfcA